MSPPYSLHQHNAEVLTFCKGTNEAVNFYKKNVTLYFKISYVILNIYLGMAGSKLIKKKSEPLQLCCNSRRVKQ